MLLLFGLIWLATLYSTDSLSYSLLLSSDFHASPPSPLPSPQQPGLKRGRNKKLWPGGSALEIEAFSVVHSLQLYFEVSSAAAVLHCILHSNHLHSFSPFPLVICQWFSPFSLLSSPHATNSFIEVSLWVFDQNWRIGSYFWQPAILRQLVQL